MLLREALFPLRGARKSVVRPFVRPFVRPSVREDFWASNNVDLRMKNASTTLALHEGPEIGQGNPLRKKLFLFFDPPNLFKWINFDFLGKRHFILFV